MSDKVDCVCGVINGDCTGSAVSERTSFINLPHGVNRPLYYADGVTPLTNGAAWVDISNPNLPTVREFYAPNSFDLSFDFSFQG
jgi:hypothetical protein